MSTISDAPEIWKSIPPDFYGFEASNHGRIRRIHDQQIVAASPHTGGYRTVMLKWGGLCKRCYVHRLVAAAFFRPCPYEMEVNHKNCNKTDNRPENLEYLSRLENIAHAVANGRMQGRKGMRSEDASTCKLNADKVREIRRLRNTGVSLSELGRQFGVSAANIQAICRRETWKNVA